MKKILTCIFLMATFFYLSEANASVFLFPDIFVSLPKDTNVLNTTKDSTNLSLSEKHLRGQLQISGVSNIFQGNDTVPLLYAEDIEEFPDEDESWIALTSYFSVWDVNKVNPYKIDPCVFKDTLKFNLVDSAFFSFQNDSLLRMDTFSMRGASAPTGPTSKSSGFGFRGIRFHSGIDLRLKKGEPVYAAFDGVVRIISKDCKGYGNFVVIRHYNGLETLYGHLNFSILTTGQEIRAGELLGYGGNTGRSTGPHLHFETRFQGNPIDPELLFDFNTNSLLSDRFTLVPAHFAYAIEKKKRIYHTIKKGNTLSGISHKYKVPVRTLCRMNNISTKKLLKIGKKLRVR